MSPSKRIQIKHPNLLGVNIIADASIPKDTVVIVPGNATWYRWDTFSVLLKCTNRLKTAWRALTTGYIEIEYRVRSDRKDKTYRLKGTKKGW
jgi:hypothetical protein